MDITWHQRGGLTREEAWEISPLEIIQYKEAIKERIEITNQTNIPLL